MPVGLQIVGTPFSENTFSRSRANFRIERTGISAGRRPWRAETGTVRSVVVSSTMSGAESNPAATPLMRQYHAIKQQVPGALLMFRLGDFYELFYEDAVTAARELEITLTSRNKEKGAAIPMCGVPYHSAEGYIARLIGRVIGWRSASRWKNPGRGKSWCGAR